MIIWNLSLFDFAWFATLWWWIDYDYRISKNWSNIRLPWQCESFSDSIWTCIIIINHVYIYIHVIQVYAHLILVKHCFLKGENNKKNHNLVKPRKPKPGCWTATFFRAASFPRWPPNASAPQQGISMSPRSSCTSRREPGNGWKERVNRPVGQKTQKRPGFFSTQTWCFFFWVVGKPHQNLSILMRYFMGSLFRLT